MHEGFLFVCLFVWSCYGQAYASSAFISYKQHVVEKSYVFYLEPLLKNHCSQVKREEERERERSGSVLALGKCPL